MKKFFISMSMLISLVGNTQNFLTNGNLDELLEASCSFNKKILIEFYDTSIPDISDVDRNFIQKYFVTSSAPIGGELSELFGVKENNYYILDRDGYKMLSFKPKNLMVNIGRASGIAPSDCKLNDIRRDDSLLKKRTESSTVSDKKTETIQIYEDESYVVVEKNELYQDFGSVPQEELLELNGVEADFVVQMETNEAYVEEKDIYTVQVDVFSTLEAAKKRASVVRKNPIVTEEVFVNQTHVDELGGGIYYRVSTGKFSSEEECLNYQKTLFRKLKPDAQPGSKGWKDAIVKKINKKQILN